MPAPENKRRKHVMCLLYNFGPARSRSVRGRTQLDVGFKQPFDLTLASLLETLA